jgi:hypothetical protein
MGEDGCGCMLLALAFVFALGILVGQLVEHLIIAWH